MPPRTARARKVSANYPTKNMKKLIVSLLTGLLCAACTAVEEAGTDVTEKFEQGITGHGRLISPSQTGDAFGSFYQ